MNAQSSEQNVSPVSSETPMFTYRAKASKIVFVLCTLIFFINYFLVGAGFFADTFIQFLPYTYVLFDISFLLCLYYILMHYFQGVKRPIGYAIFAIFGVLFMLFLLPVIFKENVLSFFGQ